MACKHLPSNKRLGAKHVCMGLAGYEVLAGIERAASLLCTVLVEGVGAAVQTAAHCGAALLAFCAPTRPLLGLRGPRREP